MNVVFLSPHFPPTWYQFATALRDEGATTLGVAEEPWDRLRPELRDAMAHHDGVGLMNIYRQLA